MTDRLDLHLSWLALLSHVQVSPFRPIGVAQHEKRLSTFLHPSASIQLGRLWCRISIRVLASPVPQVSAHFCDAIFRSEEGKFIKKNSVIQIKFIIYTFCIYLTSSGALSLLLQVMKRESQHHQDAVDPWPKGFSKKVTSAGKKSSWLPLKLDSKVNSWN